LSCLLVLNLQADKKRVMDYIKRLDKYDGPNIAKIAISDQYKLYEEAFFIYKKFKKGPEAIQRIAQLIHVFQPLSHNLFSPFLAVLLDNLNSMERATEFAEYWDQPDVWSLLAKAQLDANMVKESIKSFLKADDASHFADVIQAAKHEELYDPLIQYLKVCLLCSRINC
jgi:clathrin heavy chain